MGPPNQKKLVVVFHWLFEVSWEGLLATLVAKVSEMGITWAHFSIHFAGKLERWNLWFRVSQTPLFTVLRGWVGTCGATFSKMFSKMALGMLFDNIFWILGSKGEPKWALRATFVCFGLHFVWQQSPTYTHDYWQAPTTVTNLDMQHMYIAYEDGSSQ